MVISLSWGDLKTNLRIEGGTCKCHGNLDFELTPSGDLAIITDPGESITQRIILWLATPKGERRDPAVGCLLWEYLHQKLTGSTLKELEVRLTRELSLNFPDLSVSSVDCELVTGFGEGGNKVLVTAVLGSHKIEFMYGADELNTLYDSIWGSPSLEGR